MSKLGDIAIQVETGAATGQVLAVLHEIQDKLTQLAVTDTSSSIDLRSLPLFPGDQARLQRLLGKGEISVTLNAFGPSEIYETAIAGVWWLTHYNPQEEVVAEYLEITRLPSLLQTEPAQIEQGQTHLQHLIDTIDSDLDSPEEAV